MDTSWNLGLLYKSENDPQIEKDIQTFEKLCASFEKKYRRKDFIKSPETLYKALQDADKISEYDDAGKVVRYFSFRSDLDSNDMKAFALSTKYGERLTEASNKTKFFDLKIADIPKNRQKLFLDYPKLKPFKYLLFQTFKNARYKLSEGEEQLKSLLSESAYGMWIDLLDKSYSKQLVVHRGKKLPISKVSGLIPELPKTERRNLHNQVMKVSKSLGHIAEAEINAIYNYKKVMDKRRNYEKPYSATILGYENDEKSIEGLVALVTKHFKISHKFYKLHAKLIGEKKLTQADRAVKLGKINKKFNFAKTVSVVRDSFKKFGQEYADILDNYLTKGQIDVYPKMGKTGGAYCAYSGKLPTFVLLNHVDEIRSVETLAHEMGHAFHGEMSKSQPARYRYYTTAVAEVASTFFEQLVMDNLESLLSEREKIIMLHNRILGDISTIFRQIALFNFETELHEKVRNEGQVSKEDMAKLLVKHMKSYMGDVFDMTEEDGYQFVGWSHIRRFFYVYSYAYGQLISRALYEEYKKNKSYSTKIKQFLQAGGSMSPEDIFKSIGVDTSKPEFFKAGLDAIERDIVKLGRLSKKL